MSFDPIRPILSLMATEVDRVRAELRAGMASSMLMLAAVLLVVAGVTLLMVGVYESLATTLPAWQAAGAASLGALVPSAALLASGRMRRGSGHTGGRPNGDRSVTQEELEEAAELGAAASEFLRHYRPKGLELTTAALVAGLVFSRTLVGAPRRSGRDE